MKIDLSEYVNIKLIKDFIKENNFTKTSFCKKCNISLWVFNNIIKYGDFTISQLERISKVMNVSMSELFSSEKKFNNKNKDDKL